MGFRRYVAPSAREALDRIRKELGPEAVILSNRRLAPGKVEIIAAASGQMRALVENLAPAQDVGGFGARAHAAPSAPAVATRRPAPVSAPSAPRASAPAPRVAPESFQEFIRRQSAGATAAPAPAPAAAVPEGIAMYRAVSAEDPAQMALDARMATPPAPDPRVHTAAMVERAMVERAMGERAMVEPDTRARAEPAAVLHPPMAMEPAVFRRRPSRLSERPRAHATAPETPAPQPAATPAAAVENVERPKIASDARVMDELRSLRSVLSDRITHLEARIAPLSATVAARASPAAAVADSSAISARAARAALPASRQQALTRLIMSGFSPELARRLAEAVPGDIDPKAVDGWLQSAVGRQIACPEESDNPLFAGGAVALVGPTGVGKTTTIAKLAARFVVRHGAGALGLVTLDSYRIGAHEQLRGYGRILGVPVHSAHDAASLGELLASMHGKHRVLIDTCGMSQRDQRLAEMLAMLEQVRFAGNPIRRVLLINAASHAETIDEVARAWRVEATQGAVLTKIDEAARIGGALDALVRHRLPLLGLTNGQRVPEDWHPGNPLLLAHIALKPLAAAFCLDGEPLHALPGTGVVIA